MRCWPSTPTSPPTRTPWRSSAPPAVLHAPVRHERPMLSLDKATTPEQVEAFMARFPGQRVVVMPKLDGLSLSVIYDGGRLVRAATRGDGTTGEDVTPIARVALDGVPEEIPSTGRIEIRGEAVMLRSTFAAYNAAHPDKPLVNPRNGAAGTLRQKDASKALDRRLAFFAFDIHPPVDTDLEAVLDELSLQTPDMAHADTAEEAVAAIRAIEKTRGDSDADLDGAVVAPREPGGLRGGRRAREQPARRARVQVPGRGEDDRPRATSSGTSGRSARSRRSRSWSRCSSRARPCAARRSPTRR